MTFLMRINSEGLNDRWPFKSRFMVVPNNRLIKPTDSGNYPWSPLHAVVKVKEIFAAIVVEDNGTFVAPVIFKDGDRGVQNEERH